MAEKKYRVVFSGELADRHVKEDVLRKLSLMFKAEENDLACLFDGNPWVIRNRITQNKAEKYEGAFNRCGALCYIEDIEAAQEDASPPDENQTVGHETGEHQARNTESTIFSFESYALAPHVFAKSVSIPVMALPGGELNSDGEPHFFIRSKKPILGNFFAFIMASILSLGAEIMLLPTITEILGTTMRTTVTSALLYIVLIWVIYSLLTGKKHFFFYKKDDEVTPFFGLVSARRFKTGYSAYKVIDSQGNGIGFVKKNRHKKIYKAFTNENEEIIIGESLIEADSVVMNAMFAIRERIIDSIVFDIIQVLFEKSLKPLLGGLIDSEIFDAVEEWIGKNKEGHLFLIRNTNLETIVKCWIRKKRIKMEVITENDSIGVDHRFIFAVGILLSEG